MSATSLGTHKDLKKIYDIGAMAGDKTITHYDIGGDHYTPVEVTITDSQMNGKKAFWMADVDETIHSALENGDTAKSNPNLPVLQAIFATMAETRKALGHPPYEPKKALMPQNIETLFSTPAVE